ncbi:MAG: tRNA epoxyqueuosine(34) reductase QueG [Planctomycetaceae bacterium]|nr:tRNA epoxyqueuosine(34) reductase QueG [Planctomycetaceae bacterium]
MTPADLTAELKRSARELGFVLTGACPAVAPGGITHLAEWLAAGHAGQMRYLGDRLAAYAHPQSILEGVRSLLMLGLPYQAGEPASAGAGEGRVSRYAWGSADYHDVIHRQLRKLEQRVRQLQPSVRVRGVVDTAPLLEREFGQRAGLGWIGKNTMLLNRHAGSWFFLAALLLDCVLDYDAPWTTDHCGTCRACLDACPTAAFPQPYVLDATRCISYLTIELRQAVEPQLRPAMGQWVFGCDICQEVCPWNRRVSGDSEWFAPRPDLNPLSLVPLFALDDDAFRAQFRHTPLWRARRQGLLRSAAIALGNHPVPEALPALRQGLHDADVLVRTASAWALGRFPLADVSADLTQRLAVESNPDVREEIRQALAGRNGKRSENDG